MKLALIDLKTSNYPMIRCPYCNSWDRALDLARPGIYQCEVCGDDFELGKDRSVDTVPESVRKEMDEASAHNAALFGGKK